MEGLRPFYSPVTIPDPGDLSQRQAPRLVQMEKGSTMIAKLKKEAMKQGMKMMSNPKFMQMMSDPRVMKAIGNFFTLRGRVQSEMDCRLRSMAETFNFATKDEVKDLKRNMSRVESALDRLERDGN